MTDATDALHVATRLYEALEGDDIAPILELCAEDVTILYPAEGVLPYGGTWHGREGATDFLETHDESEEILEFDVGRLIDDGDTVIALGSFKGRAKPDGPEWATPFVHHLTISGGLVRRWEAFFDTAAAVAAHRSEMDTR